MFEPIQYIIVGTLKDIDDESLERWKIALAKSSIEYKTDKEYYEALQNFTSFIDTLVEIDKRVKADESAGKMDGGGYFYDKDGNKIIY
jgi:hypothetical protein